MHYQLQGLPDRRVHRMHYLGMLVPFPARFVDTGKLPLTLDSCLRGND